MSQPPSSDSGGSPAFPPGFEIPGQKALVAHAAIMCVVFVLFMPLAAVAIRSPILASVTRVHAPWQVFNVCLGVVGMGLGVSVANTRQISLSGTPHTVLGFVIVGCLVVVQPVMGVLQHLYHRKRSRRGLFGWMHMLLGRLLLVLGLVNGARGFKLAHDVKAAPYYAVLAVVCAVYVAVLLWDWVRPKYLHRRGKRAARTTDETGRENTAAATTSEERLEMDPRPAAK